MNIHVTTHSSAMRQYQKYPKYHGVEYVSTDHCIIERTRSVTIEIESKAIKRSIQRETKNLIRQFTHRKKPVTGSISFISRFPLSTNSYFGLFIDFVYRIEKCCLLFDILAAYTRINAMPQKKESNLHKWITEIPQWLITNKIMLWFFAVARKSKKMYRMEFRTINSIQPLNTMETQPIILYELFFFVGINIHDVRVYIKVNWQLINWIFHYLPMISLINICRVVFPVRKVGRTCCARFPILYSRSMIFRSYLHCFSIALH